MKVKLSEFPNQPGAMACCKECQGKTRKDCQPEPMNCPDFFIQNKTFMDRRLMDAEEGVKT